MHVHILLFFFICELLGVDCLLSQTCWLQPTFSYPHKPANFYCFATFPLSFVMHVHTCMFLSSDVQFCSLAAGEQYCCSLAEPAGI